MARKNHQAVTEEQTSQEQTKSQELIKAEQRVKEIRERERKDKVITEARNDLQAFESEYDHAKEVFFKVNGARRVLKNAGLL